MGKCRQTARARRNGRETFSELIELADSLGLFAHPMTQVQQKMEERFSADNRWNVLLEQDRNRMIADAVKMKVAKLEQEHCAQNHAFRELVISFLSGREEHPPPWFVVRRKLQQDERWGAADSMLDREQIFAQVVSQLSNSRRKRWQKQHLDEMEVETVKKKRRVNEAEEDLYNLFTERLKTPFDMSWNDVKSLLDGSERFQNCTLSDDEQVHIWTEYKKGIIDARKDAFCMRLESLPLDTIGPDMTFEEVLECTVGFKSGGGFIGVPKDVLQQGWEEWQELAYNRSTEVCRSWLRSCEHFCGTESIILGDPAYELLIEKLNQDIRFCRLVKKPEVQRDLVLERLKELRQARVRPQSALQDVGLT